MPENSVLDRSGTHQHLGVGCAHENGMREKHWAEGRTRVHQL